LLKYGASVNLADKAASKEHIEVVLEMLNHGASVILTDKEC